MVKDWYVGTSGFMVGQQTWLKLPGLNCIEINSTPESIFNIICQVYKDEINLNKISENGIVKPISRYGLTKLKGENVERAWEREIAVMVGSVVGALGR